MAALASSSYSLVGWSSSSLAGTGAGLDKSTPSRVQLQRRGRGGVRAAAADDEEEEPNFLQNLGTQFFKVGGTKVESAAKGASDVKSRGTQFFGLGGTRKKKAAEEEEAPKKSGTQLFGFGTQKKKAGTANGSTNGSALALRKGTTALEALPFGRGRRVDPKTVFVAGATGQVGARISQQLLRAGFSVRGGVPDLYVAQQLAEFATQYGVISRDEAKRLNAVEFDFKNVSSIAKALGNAGKVVVTVGPTEDGPLGKVTRDDALRVLEAATLSKSAHFVLVSEPGIGVSADNGPLAGLAALLGSLFSKASEVSESDLIDKIVETGLPYTFIKAGSTDGIDDYAPEGGNLVVEAEGASDPSAKVSKIEIASVVAGVFQYTGVSEDKFFEVSSSPYAPSRPVDELLSAIQVDGRRELLEEERARRAAEEKERVARLAAEEKERAARLKADSEAEEAVKEAREAAKLAAQLEAEAKRLAGDEAKAAAVAARAQAKAEAAAASVDGLREKAKELGGSPLRTIAGRLGTVSFKQDESKFKKAAVSVEEKGKKPLFSFARKVQRVEEEVEEKVKKPAFSLPKKVQRAAPQPVAAAASASPKSGGLFGGLFSQQETFYVDED
ncbi:unnamed protein product [Calypogeia fissa]